MTRYGAKNTWHSSLCIFGNIQEDRHKVEQFHFLWNSSTFFRSCDPKVEQLYKKVEQLYKKVEQVLKAGHSSTKCGTATHM